MIKKIGGLEVEIEDSLDNIINHDINRVGRYLSSLNNYLNMGYKIRFPNVQDITKASYKEIKDAVVSEVNVNKDEYALFRDGYFDTFNKIVSAGIEKTTRVLYGIELPKKVMIVPTLYGTISSPMNLEKGTPFVIRVDKYIEGIQTRTRTELLIHEVWAHGFTSSYRAETELDDNLGIKTVKPYPKHKERLMDLFGRTLLVRTSLMQRNDVTMQNKMYEDIINEVDEVYYIDKSSQNEFQIKDEGDLRKIIRNVIVNIKR